VLVDVAPAPSSDPLVHPRVPSFALPNPLASAALARPLHPALECGARSWTARALVDAAALRAGGLLRAGVRAGEVVALEGPPDPEWVITLHALAWAGAVVAPLPPEAPEDERTRLVEALGPAHRVGPGGLRWEEEGPPAAERFWPLDEPRLVLLTSGTTGAARRVTLTTGQLAFSAFGSALRLGHALHDRWLACLPLHHVGGLSVLLRCAWYATTVVLHERFEPARVAALLDAGQTTIVSLVPTMLERVLDARPERPFPASLRAVLLGGAPASASLVERCRELRVPLALTWGMSETASQVATRFPGDFAPDAGCGPPLAFARVEAGDAGALAIRGPLTPCGATHPSGDHGALDAQGRVHVTGRLDDVLISGGEKIAPRELVAVLERHPAVREAAVVAVSHPEWGQRPLAALVPREGLPLPDEAHLRAWCRERLSPFKVPDGFVWLAELPRNDLGKVSRQALRRHLDAATRRPQTPAAAPHAAPPRRPVAAVDLPAARVLDSLAGVALERDLPDTAARLVELREWLTDDLRGIEEQLVGLSASEGHLAQRAAGHLLATPGKRLRPLGLLLAARLLDPRARDPRARDAALAAELLHAATLLHDDVIDEGERRRGSSTARRVYGNSASVLGGDHVLGHALRLVQGCRDPRLSDSFLGVIADMVAAEALQLERRGTFVPCPRAYTQVVRGKTAALFRWALGAGGTLAGLDGAGVSALERAGDALGEAFQLTDDLLDVAGDPALTGKDTWTDLREGKLTWPLVVGCQRDPELEVDLRAIAAGEELDPAPVLNRLRATGALEATQARARRCGEEAADALRALPAGPARDALTLVVEAAVERAR
jgi:geranylgeranyl pyrophosphate synthase/acyl-CoA synthetase (AMP-forming)/AMP-acid ligase II